MKRTICTLMTVLMMVTMLSVSASAASYNVVKLAEGDYYIAASSNDNFCVDVMNGSTQQGAGVWLYTRSAGNAAQIFTVEHVSGDWFVIKNKASGLVLNVPNANNANGQQLWMWGYDGTDACLWRFADAGNGTYILQNKLGRVLDLDNNLLFDTSRLHLWDLHNGASCKWKMIRIISASTSAEEGYIKLGNPNNRLNLRASASTNSAVITTLRHGVKVEILEKLSGWTKIRVNGTTGYVASQYVVTSAPASNSASQSTTFDPIWPCETAYHVSALYYYKNGSVHSTRYGYQNGMDIAGGGNILSVESGVVETVENLGSKSFGKYIVIKHNNGTRSLYAHLASFATGIQPGMPVSKGQVIGVMGSTGNSSGPHLHFEMSSADPWREYYADRYQDQINFAYNVRRNNACYNTDRYIVNYIDTYYTYSNGVYRAK